MESSESNGQHLQFIVNIVFLFVNIHVTAALIEIVNKNKSEHIPCPGHHKLDLVRAVSGSV